MGKITPPPVFRVNIRSDEAVVTIEELKSMIQESIEEPIPEFPIAWKCPCCGAPIHSDHCEYCGVEFKNNKL